MEAHARMIVAGLAVAVALLSAPPALAGDEIVAKRFEEFCQSWMGKLAEREVYNIKQAEWRPHESGVEGEYVGYSVEHTCDLKNGEDRQVPIGKVTYREMRYRKSGPTSEAAVASPGQILEITEVTEIFRYAKGRWVY